MAHEEAVRSEAYTYTVVFEPAEEGGYVVTVPALPGVVTEGDSLDEARVMAIDAIEGHLEVLRDLGRDIPIKEPRPGSEAIREPITVRLKTG